MKKPLNTLYHYTRSRVRISKAFFPAIFVLVYVVFFVPSYGSDAHILPASITLPITNEAGVSQSSSAPSSPSAQQLVPFLYNSAFGYLTTNGELATLLPISYGVAYSSARYSPYDPINHPIVLYGTDGRPLSVIDQHGYPVLDQDRIVILHQNGNSISEWNLRTEQWRRDFSATISAIDVSQTNVAIAFFDGHAIIVDQAGDRVAHVSHPTVETPVFSTISLSDDQELCVVYEVTHKQILFFDVSEDTSAPVRTIELSPTLGAGPSFPYLTFLPHSKNIIYHDGVGLYLHHFSSAETISLHHAATLIDVDMNNAYVATITRSATQTLLSIYTADGTLTFQIPLIDYSTVSDHFVQFSDPDIPSFILGIENRILSLAYREQS